MSDRPFEEISEVEHDTEEQRTTVHFYRTDGWCWQATRTEGERQAFAAGLGMGIDIANKRAASPPPLASPGPTQDRTPRDETKPPPGYRIVFKSHGPWMFVRPDGKYDVGCYRTYGEACHGAWSDHRFREHTSSAEPDMSIGLLCWCDEGATERHTYCPVHGASAPRDNHLAWNGTEWVDDRCGCRYHPDDDNGSHGGAPHVHRCERHSDRTPRDEAGCARKRGAVKPKYEPKTIEQKLGYLVEECGEVLAAVGKTLRWGLQSYNPELLPGERESNREWILRELKDLDGAIWRVRDALGNPHRVLLNTRDTDGEPTGGEP